jgi:Ca2+-binding RTX toxin-like protein
MAGAGVALAAAIAGFPPGTGAGPRCGGLRADMVGTPGRDVLVAPVHGKQVIYGGGGDDRIVGRRNHDVICGGGGDDLIIAGQGNDRVYGGPGDDRISTGRGKDRVEGEDGNDNIRGGAGGDKLSGGPGTDTIRGDTGKDRIQGGGDDDALNGGPGKDTVWGESGDDSLQGDAGGDYLHGGPGDDRIYGELQDDHLFGDDGSDLLIGDQGIDHISGGNDDDWMRGGTNQDVYEGGPGSDTVSFATATPPGPTSRITGVQVDLRRGFAKGDGGEDTIRNTEGVLGSPYDDLLIGTGAGSVDGLGGVDDCQGFGEVLDCPSGISSAPGDGAVMLEDGPDPGLIVVPRRGSASDTIQFSSVPGGYSVSVGGPVEARAPCQPSGSDVFCPAPSEPLGYVVAYGGDGNDRLSIGHGFPYTTTVDLDGGNGDDRLEGSDNNDNLYAGEFGHDVLIGNAGADALISEAGSDLLIGGPGNDQLVTSAPCDGHVFDGGTGAADVAGFGRTYYNAVKARLGGTAVERGAKHCTPTTIRKNKQGSADRARGQGPMRRRPAPQLLNPR